MKKLVLSIFVVLCLIQLYVPLSMIMDYEDILNTGKQFKFKTRPLDPNDPFKGKYINLYFENNALNTKKNKFKYNDKVNVCLNPESKIASIDSITYLTPNNSIPYFEARVLSSSIIRIPSQDEEDSQTLNKDSTKVRLDYDFDKFYMEESKAPIAENIYMEVARDSTKEAYALVRVKHGKAVLEDVLIDDTPLLDLIIKN